MKKYFIVKKSNTYYFSCNGYLLQDTMLKDSPFWVMEKSLKYFNTIELLYDKIA
jgi:hypothetical protein